MAQLPAPTGTTAAQAWVWNISHLKELRAMNDWIVVIGICAVALLVFWVVVVNRPNRLARASTPSGPTDDQRKVP